MKPKMIECPKLYPDTNPWDVEPHYARHVGAMTRERLDSKADIAVQLAWRDQEIENLRTQLKDARCLQAELARVYREEHEQIAPLLAAAAKAEPQGAPTSLVREARASARLDGETYCLSDEGAPQKPEGG